MRHLAFPLFAVLTVAFATEVRAQEGPRIIDMHLHALPVDAQGPPPLAICAPVETYPTFDPGREDYGEAFIGFGKDPTCTNPVWTPESDEALMEETIAALERFDMIGVTSGPLVDAYEAAAPDRILPAFLLDIGTMDVTPDSLRRALESGKYVALAEVINQYSGIAPDDPRFDPYLAVAEELDIPVGIHIGTGPPGAPYLGFEKYRARLHSPLTLEEALAKHPDLRVWVMHAGWPMLDDMLAVLYAHPQVHVGVGVIAFTLPRAEFHRYLRRIVEAGFGNRVMFGSDQMVWPGAIEFAIEAIESADFLTEEQKRAILHDNAARFLRLEEEEPFAEQES
ncbi:MAG: amidohydrolase family protein [Gemmatimonadota bacterium]|nr:amidohydrolase family protein [Gemmatimonadota bacterium]